MTTSAAPFEFRTRTVSIFQRESVRALIVAVVGATVIAVGTRYFKIPASHALQIVAIAAAVSLATTIAGAAVLYALRHRSLSSQVSILVCTTIVGAGLGSWAVAKAMFLSEHDFSVLAVVLVTAGVWSMLSALVLGRRIANSADRLVEMTKRLGSAHSKADMTTRHASELERMAIELRETSQRLSNERERADALDRSRRELVKWMTGDVNDVIARIERSVHEGDISIDANLRQDLDQLRKVGSDIAELHVAD